jgi:hypothetical protein
MHTVAHDALLTAHHPVDILVEPTTEPRNRVSVAFRILLAIPHLILVGGPIALAVGWSWNSEPGATHEWSASGGVLGAVAAVTAMISWFAILFTGTHPDGLRALATFYLRWRVRVTAYVGLLRDEYPPFGDAYYPAALVIDTLTAPRDRLSVVFRLLLVIPQLIVVCLLSIARSVTTLIAWFAILFTGRYPTTLAHFAVGVMRWSIRVEAYLLLLHDEYPPFRLAQ